MPIYKPTELFEFLNELGIAPKKGFSQNFLIDGNVLRKIVTTAAIQPNDLILEIGPGPGSLSELILEKNASLIAVEKDGILAQSLNRLKSPTNKLEVFSEDILDFPIEAVLRKHLLKGQKAKIVANLPYHITTQIVTRLVPLHEIIDSVIIMVQEEVARRYTAPPGGSDYSSITLFLNYHADVKYGFKVSKNCFYPSPKVDSAIVSFKLKEPPKVTNPEAFFKVVRETFQHRRKMLRGTLKSLYSHSDIESILEKIGKSPLARPQELSLTEFIQLFERLTG